MMELEGEKFIVEKVYSQALGDMTVENAREDGFTNMEEYKDSILSIHPGMRWVPTMKVWVHDFRAV